METMLKKYFYFTEKVESEELDKLNIIMKNRYYLQKKILYYYSKNDNIIYNNEKNMKKTIKLLKVLDTKKMIFISLPK